MRDSARLRRFLAPTDCSIGETVTLGPAQSRHAVTVLRTARGARVRLFTGTGREFVGEVVQADPSGARVRILEEVRPAGRPLPAVTLGFAPAPGNRSDFVIEKATELGAARLVPLLCERLQGGHAQAAARRAERWRRKAREAARQSQRALVPEVTAPVPFERFVRGAQDGLRIVAARADYPGLLGVLGRLRRAPASVGLAVGPAGGFTRRELELAQEAGFEAVSLGPHVLRVETAAVCLLAGVVLYFDAAPF